jgi:hypothetical protein
MSTPTDPHDPSGPLAYAPKWARDGRATRPSDRAPELVPDDRPSGEGKSSRLPAVDAYPFPFEGDAPTQQLRARRLDPDSCPPPPMQVQTRSTVAVVGRLVLVVVIAALIALFAVEEFPVPSAWKASGDKAVELASAASRSAPTPAPAQASRSVSTPAPAQASRSVSVPAPAQQRTVPRLVAVGGRGIAGEPAPIGVTLEGNADGAVMIHGLPSGMGVSMGEAIGASSWRVAAADLASTWVLPPQDFIGAIDLGVELRLADDVVADRRTVRLEWSAPPPAAPAAAEPAVRSLDRDEIATLIKRSEDFIAAGDLAAARVLLRRAAEARDAGAALALAATYDPIVLERLKVYGFSADVDTARAWYEKAKEFGSAEAPRRLELLASQTR